MNNSLRQPGDKKVYGLFNDSFPPIIDGVTLTVENYARWLRESGKETCVVTPWNPIREDVPYEVMRYFSLPIRNRYPYRYGYPKLDPFIWRKLRHTGFRLVHAHCPFSSGRLAVYVKKHQKVPLIGTFHSKYRSDLEHSFRLMPWCVPIIMKRILDFFNVCDEVWIPQAQVEETVREYGYKGHLEVVENGNDFAGMTGNELKEYRKRARQRLGLPERTINLLFVGQHIWEKGLQTIVDTLRLLDGKSDFRMNFIGNGYASADLVSQIKSSGLENRVRVNGIITDREKLREYYAASDLFLFPSFYDNAPLVVREAAAMGTPSVLLRGSTAAEVVSDGKNGFLVGNNPRDFAALTVLLEHDRDTLARVAEGARETLVRSWENVVEEVADRYDALVRRYV